MLQKEPPQPSFEYAEPTVDFSEVHRYFEGHDLHLGDVGSSQYERDYYGPVLVGFIVDKTAAWTIGDGTDHSSNITRETLTAQFLAYEDARRQAKAQGQLAMFNTRRGRLEAAALRGAQDIPTIAVALATLKGLGDSEAGDIARDIVVSLGIHCREQSMQNHGLVVQRAGSIALNGEVQE